ncbi:UPF0725 protein EMB2204-like [Raphanus sativus]|uniref:UPF0725 protein EMB2204-like n=1 Tax=Raphanus sativus TaxID=3726 RepID=A0A6J0KK66_RAPSA|nr:UPF0725 protein EMB2204-like [Raphanus sativus]
MGSEIFLVAQMKPRKETTLLLLANLKTFRLEEDVFAGEHTKEMSQSCVRREELDFFNFPEGFPPRRWDFGWIRAECGEGRVYPNCALANLYAKLGLHRYNWLEGTNFELDSLMKFIMRGAASPYYMTLVARLPSTGFQQVFQVLVREVHLGILDLKCTISRPQGSESSKESTPFLRPHSEPVSTTFPDRLAGWNRTKSVIPWPSTFSDTKQRFYMLNESELQCDWISLYVELAICTSHRWITARDLSKFDLEIVQVAIESLDDKEPPSLKSEAAVIYIAYKDLAKARTGEPYHYQAVVRRIVDGAIGKLSIQGDCWIAEEAATAASALAASKKGSRKLKRRLGVPKLWRLSSPRWYQTYKNRGLRSSPTS